MRELVHAFVDITLLRRGPEHLPPSVFLLQATLLAYLLTSAAAATVSPLSGVSAVLDVSVDVGFTIAWFWLLLLLYGRRHRFVQTLTALLGTQALLTALSLPILAWNSDTPPGADSAGLARLAIGSVFFWALGVIGHILSRALELPYVGGLLIAVAYAVAQISIFSALTSASG